MGKQIDRDKVKEMEALCKEWVNAYPAKAQGEARNVGTEAPGWCLELCLLCNSLYKKIERLETQLRTPRPQRPAPARSRW